MDKEEVKLKVESKIRAEKAKHASNGDGLPVMPNPLSWQNASVSRFLSEKPPEQDYLLDRLLTRNTVGGVFAPGGTGKSFVLIQVSCCLATNRDFGVFRPKRGRDSKWTKKDVKR